MEKLIIEFNLPMICNLNLTEEIVVKGYKKTSNKFWVQFQGSKGYLCLCEISCEGSQTERNNIIWLSNLRNNDGSYFDKTVKIFHSKKDGVRVEII